MVLNNFKLPYPNAVKKTSQEIYEDSVRQAANLPERTVSSSNTPLTNAVKAQAAVTPEQRLANAAKNYISAKVGSNGARSISSAIGKQQRLSQATRELDDAKTALYQYTHPEETRQEQSRQRYANTNHYATHLESMFNSLDAQGYSKDDIYDMLLSAADTQFSDAKTNAESKYNVSGPHGSISSAIGSRYLASHDKEVEDAKAAQTQLRNEIYTSQQAERAAGIEQELANDPAVNLYMSAAASGKIYDTPADGISDQERATLYALDANNDPRYADYKDYLDRKASAVIAERTDKWLEDKPYLVPLTELGAALTVPISYLATGYRAVSNALTGNYVPLDPNSSAMAPARIMSNNREILDNYISDPVAKFMASDVGLSIIDMAPALIGGGLAGKAITKAAGKEIASKTGLSAAEKILLQDTAKTAASKSATRVTTGYMGLEAAGQSSYDAIKNGASPGQAFTHATIQGLEEALFEKLPMERLMHTAFAGKKALFSKSGLNQVLRQAGIEAPQELVTQYAQTLSDMAVMGKKSVWYQTYNAYLSYGYSEDEARQRTNVDLFILDPLRAALAGGVTGGILGAGATTISGGLTNRQANNAALTDIKPGKDRKAALDQETKDAVLETGMESPKGTAARQQAEAIKTKLDAGEEVTDNEWGALYRANTEQVYEERAEEEKNLQSINRSQSLPRENISKDALLTMSKTFGEKGESVFNSFMGGVQQEDVPKAAAAWTVMYNAGRSGANMLEAGRQFLDVMTPAQLGEAYQAGHDDLVPLSARPSVRNANAGVASNSYSAALSKDDRTILNALGISEGVRIELVEPGSIETHLGGTANGSYDNKTATIKVDASDPDIMWTVIKHELTHRMRSLAPKEYTAYKNYIIKSIVEGKSSRRFSQELMDVFNIYTNGGSISESQEDLIEEVVADYTANFMSTPEGAKAICRDNPEMGRGILNWIRDMLRKIGAILKGSKLSTEERQAFGLARDQLKTAEKLYVDGLRAAAEAAKTLPAAESAEGGKPRYHISSIQKNVGEKIITVGMSDGERAEILRGKELPVITYEGQADEQIEANRKDLERQKRSVVAEALKRISEDFDIPLEIKNDDYDMVVTRTSGLFNESISKEITDPKQLAKLIPVLDRVVRSAVGIESHANRYFYDDNTVMFHNLVGGYIDGDYFVPIRFGVKQSVDGMNYLYVVIDDKAIKKSGLFRQSLHATHGQATDYPTTISIADVLSKVNSPEILKYVPDEFLDEERKAVKYQAIADTIRRTNDKNDEKYAKFIAAGNLAAAKRMVLAAAEAAMPDSKVRDAAGKLLRVYHGTESIFTVFDPTVSGGKNGTAEGFGIYVSPSQEVTKHYGGRQISLYANITHPARNDQKTIKASVLEALIKDTCEREAQTLVAEDEYESIDEAIKDTWISNYVNTYEAADMDAAYKQVAQDILRMNESDMMVVQEVMAGMAIRNYDAALEFYRNSLTPVTGIDGFVTEWKNNETGENIPVILALESSQLKSADPVTYDDNGNVIPLSERFNTEEDDIRYSIAKTLKRDLADVKDGKFNAKENEVHIGTTSNFLMKEIGAAPLEQYMPPAKAYAAMVSREEALRTRYYAIQRDYHDLGVDLLYNILVESETPVVAFAVGPDESGEKRPGRIVLVTDLKIAPDPKGTGKVLVPAGDPNSKGAFAVAVVQLDTFALYNKKRIKANKTITTYDDEILRYDLEKAIKDDRLLFVDKKRSQIVFAGVRGDNGQAAIRNIDFKKNIQYFWDEVKWSKQKISFYSTDTNNPAPADTTMAAAIKKAQAGAKATAANDTEVKSSSAELRDLRRERDRLERENRRLRQEWTRTKIPTMSRGSVITIARKVLADTGNTGVISLDEFSLELESLYNSIARGELETWEEVMAEARKLAEKLVDSASVYNDDLFREYKGMREYFRTTPVFVPEKARDSQPWTEFKKAYRNRIRFNDQGVDVTRVYAEAAGMWPEFFPEDIEEAGAQIEQIAEVLDSLRGVYENPFSGWEDTAVEQVAHDLYERFYEASEMHTRMDRLRERNEAAKAHIKQEAKENKAAAVEKLRETQKQRLDRIDLAARMHEQRLIGKERQKKNDAVEKLQAHYTARTEEAREKQQAAILRAKITRSVSRLSTTLRRPTDKKHIPQGLIPVVANALASINMGSAYVYELQHDGTYKRVPASEAVGGRPMKKTVTWLQLKEQYQQLAGNGELVIASELLDGENEAGLIQQVINMGDTPIGALSLEQLRTVWQALRAIEASVRTGNRLLSMERWGNVGELADALLKDNDYKKDRGELPTRAGREMQKLLSLDMLSPEAYFHMLGPTGDYLFRKWRDGQDAFILMLKDSTDFTNRLIADVKTREMEKHLHTVTLGGKKVQLSTAQMMDLHNLIKRDQALQHILVGGILPEARKGKAGKRLKNVEPIRNVTMEELNEADRIFRKEAPEAARIADSLQRYCSTVLAEAGNRASMQVFGIEKFGEESYWPIRTNRQEIKTEIGKNDTNMTSFANKGFTKLTNPSADNSVVLGNALVTFSDHVVEMATYASYLAIGEDMNRIFNYQQRNEEGLRGASVKGMLDRVFGNLGMKHGSGSAYWLQLEKDIANGVKSEWESISDTLISNYKATAVGVNLRVILQQPTAIMRALSMIDSKYYLTNVGNPLKGWQEMKKYMPIAQWKDWGYFDINTGRQIKDVLFRTESGTERIRELGMTGMAWADSVSWGYLWNAVKREIKATRPDLAVGSQEFYEAAAARCTEIIDRTQVVDGMLQRPQIMRSSHALTKMATSFMSEPMKTYNMALIAGYDVKHARNAAARKIAFHAFLRTAYALLLSFLLNAAAQSIWDAVRDDDQDKDYWEKYWAAFTGFTGDEETVSDKVKAFVAGNIESAINPLTYIPYAKDVFSLASDSDVNRMDMESLDRSITALKNVWKAVNGDSKLTVGNALLTATGEISRLWGIPLYNLQRDLKAGYLTAVQNSGSEWAEYKALTYLNNMAKDKGEFMDLLYRAYKESPEDFEKIYADMVEKDKLKTDDKTTEEYITGELNKRMAADKGVTTKELSPLDKFLPQNEADKFDPIVNYIKSTEAWRNAPATVRDKTVGLAYDYATGNSHADDDATIVNEGKAYGLTWPRYAEYYMALYTADATGDGNNSIKQAEVQNALYAINASAEMGDYLFFRKWPAAHKRAEHWYDVDVN